jgi:hypothetical protein
MDALMKIEGFKSLNEDINMIINKSESIKEIKLNANEKDISKKEKKNCLMKKKSTGVKENSSRIN